MDVLLTASKRRFTGPIPKTRSLTGPTPNSVAILERPKLKKPADWRIIERRKLEDQRDSALARVDVIDKDDLRCRFFEATDKKLLRNRVKSKVDSMLLEQQYSLDERRERLRELLMQEEEMYFAELASKQETQLERQARMRERAKFLREKREKERMDFVEEKLEQRWRDQCEELRATKFKTHLIEVTKDRDEQLRLKSEEQERKKKEEEIYAKMWKEDELIKAKREEMETAFQIERNKEMLDILNTQTAAHLKERENLDTLQEQEAELLREQRALRAVEDMQREEEKRRRQKMTKMVLDHSLKLKMKNRAREVQEELAFDMKLLEQMLTENKNEAKDNLERKKVLKSEVQMYRKYLADQAEEEKKREKELDAIVNAEVQRQWSKRVDQWKREADARKSLLRDVLEGRKKQVEEKLVEIAKAKAEIEKEKAQVLRDLKEHEELERQQEEDKWKAKKAYQKDLLQQMDYLAEARQAERQQKVEEWELCKEAEATYQRKVKAAESTLSPERLHPTRLVLSGKSFM